jgi:hypothetical protein
MSQLSSHGLAPILPARLSVRRVILPVIVRGLCLALILSGSGCGILIGNTPAVDRKSDSYGIAELDKETPDWQKLDPKQAGAGTDSSDSSTTATEVSDVAYQSKKTSAVISLNSACRPSNAKPENKSVEADLRELTDVLLLGANNVTLRDERSATVQNTPALQTTFRGSMNHEEVMIRTIVLRRNTCIYDLVFVARPDTFAINEQEFTHFVASLRLK